jgi:hypothetical protein
MKPLQACLTVLVVVAIAGAAPGALAQDEFRIRSIRQQLLEPLDFRGLITGAARSTAMYTRWLRVEVEFDTHAQWTDELTFKYYVLMGRGRDAQLFAGEVTHLDIAKGARHYSAMFMHPNTVQRYGGRNAQAVAVLLYHEGRLIAFRSEPQSRERWWEQMTPLPRTLLNPMQSPWSVVSHDRYEAIKAGP